MTSRAKLLHYERNGIGYTAEQVYKIVTYTLVLHRKSEERAQRLRNKLNDMLRENGAGIEIAKGDDGTFSVKQRARDGP